MTAKPKKTELRKGAAEEGLESKSSPFKLKRSAFGWRSGLPLRFEHSRDLPALAAEVLRQAPAIASRVPVEVREFLASVTRLPDDH